MEGGTLFNSGFLGASFLWWVGQIADDSTWRDNILPGKFESPNKIPGWGRRYKVRIIGLHDKEEESIPSNQLPWAQVMYPVTGGGGQARSGATASLRQGNFVFGFFLDGQDQQVPVIMGVLGSNSQTPLGTKIGNSKSNFSSISGFAKGTNPDPYIKVPAEGLVVTKPTPPGTPSIPPVDGRNPARIPTKSELAAAQSARAEADRLGETGELKEARIRNATIAATRQEAEAAESSSSPVVPGATRENVDAVHQQSIADIQRNELYRKKTVLLSPCDFANSALKAIKIEIENLTNEIDKILHAAQSYVDAASQILSDIQSLISNFACTIAKYMKIVFDKIFQYVLKQINKAMSPTVDIMFPNQRNQFIDIKEKITDLIKCLYSKITGNLCAQIQEVLNDILDTRNPSSNKSVDQIGSVPFVPICSVETLTGNLISANMEEMNSTTNDIMSSVNAFLNDIQSGLSSLTGNISEASSFVNGISGGITSALSFENITLNFFGCDINANCPASDYYTLHGGGGATEEVQQPRSAEVAKSASKDSDVPATTEIPYAKPTQTSDSRSVEQILSGVGQIA